MLIVITRTETWHVPDDDDAAHMVDENTERVEEVVDSRETFDGVGRRLLNFDIERDERAFILATSVTADTASSASRQNFIDNGFYLNVGEELS